MSADFQNWLLSRRATSWRADTPRGTIERAYADFASRSVTADKFARLLNAHGFRPRRERGAFLLEVPIMTTRAGAAAE